MPGEQPAVERHEARVRRLDGGAPGAAAALRVPAVLAAPHPARAVPGRRGAELALGDERGRRKEPRPRLLLPREPARLRGERVQGAQGAVDAPRVNLCFGRGVAELGQEGEG